MPNTHAVLITSKCTCWDVDAYNRAGVATVDLDNGVAVTLTSINKNATNAIQGFEYTVAPAAANASNVWIVKTPDTGSTLEQAMFTDPRYFYNVAGRPLSLMYPNPKVDTIEVDKAAFVTGSDPTSVANSTFVTIGAGGKYVAVTAAPANGTYFSIEGTHTISIGTDILTTWLLKVERN